MRALVYLALSLLVGACASAPPQQPLMTSATALPPIRDPVLVPCLKREQVPPKPQTAIRQEFGGEKTETAMALDLRELDRYVVVTQSLLWACVETLEGK